MAVKFYWDYDPSIGITSFSVYKSTDMALTYSLLTSIAFDINGANYDRAKKKFFYNDGAGNPGDIYRILTTATSGSADPIIVVAPPAAPALCLVIGYVRDAFGEVDTGLAVNVTCYGERGQNWASNPAGSVTRNPESLGVTASTRIVYPDANGMWQVGLIRKAYARIRIPALDLDWAFEVPDKEGPVNIRDIPLLRQGDYTGLWPDQTGINPEIVRS